MYTTSLIRKIDRALFTFWLYIICRRRCVILIFIFFLSSCFVLFCLMWCCCCCCYSIYIDTFIWSFSALTYHQYSMVLCIRSLISMFTCSAFVTKMRYFLLWFGDVVVVVAWIFLSLFVHRETWFSTITLLSISKYEFVVCNIRTHQNREALNHIIIFSGFLSYSLHTYYFSVTPLFHLFIFFCSQLAFGLSFAVAFAHSVSFHLCASLFSHFQNKNNHQK